MNAVQWQRVKSIFQDAFERDPTTLRSWLDAACGDDAEVRLEVERLVEAHASAGGCLDAPV